MNVIVNGLLDNVDADVYKRQSYCIGFFLLSLAHAGFDTVVDTRSVSDDQRRSVVCFCFADSLESLSLVSAHSDLSYVYITVGSSDKTEVFLANTLT